MYKPLYTCWYTGQIPVPENVSGCVIYQDNSISLNVQWNVSWSITLCCYSYSLYIAMPCMEPLLQISMDRFNSPSTFYTIYYFSNDSDVIINNSVETERGNLENRISDILLPTNFTGQQIQVQVGLTFNSQEGSRSIPVTLGKATYNDCIA